MQIGGSYGYYIMNIILLFLQILLHVCVITVNMFYVYISLNKFNENGSHIIFLANL